MSLRVLPAVVAVIFAIALAMLLFVPFVAREYRKHGELKGHTVAVRFAALLYALGVLAYVLLPLPGDAEDVCDTYSYIRPQWTPLATFAALRSGVVNEGIVQFGLNLLLFVPLGVFTRHLLRRDLAAVALLGFGVSLVIELTQLTGNWFAYPCPYRVFDVDDLLANSIGAVVGGVLAPVLRRPSGQRNDRPARMPRPVTASRRLLGMGCDVLLLWLLGVTTARVCEAMSAHLTAGALWFVPASLLLVGTVIGRGSTLGQCAVLLRSDGCGFRTVLLRWSTGLGGLAIVETLIGPLGPDAAFAAAVMWCTVHAFGATRSRGHRGITGWLAGLEVVDARAPRAGSLTSA